MLPALVIALGPDQVTANRRRAAAVVAAPVCAALALVAALAVLVSVALAVVLAVVAMAAAVAGYRGSDAAVLAASRARPSEPVDHPRFHNLVEGLCVAAGVAKPRLYVVDDGALNAFSAGGAPRQSSVAVTSGLLEELTRIELEAVVAHELSHLKARDTSVSTLAACFVAGPALLVDVSARWRARGGARAVVGALSLVFVPVLPLVARLLRVAVGTGREAVADLAAVSLTRYPPGLIAALERMSGGSTVVSSASRATAHLWTASPLPGRDGGDPSSRSARLDALFTLHPPLEARIEALRDL